MKLGEICFQITDGKHGDCRNKPNSGFYFLSAKDVFERDLSYKDAREIEEIDFLETHKRTNLQPGDLLVTNSGTIGRVAIAKEDPKTSRTTFQKSVAILKPKRDIANSLFLYYALVFKRPLIQETAGGTTQQNLLLKDIRDFDIPLYSLSEQSAIAGILGALDDKIELNRRMNQTLESMARAVFREMTKNVEEQGSILKFANLLSGGTPSTGEASYWNGDIEWVSAKDVSNADGIFLLDTEKKITQVGVDNSSTKILPAKTVIVTARGTVGAHCILGNPMAMNQTNYGLKAKEGVGDHFVYFTLSEMVEQLKQQSYGTIFDTITTKTFHNALCSCPSHTDIQNFEEQVSPFMDSILNNQKESRTLARLRDTLLPKLMKGEVRVKDV
jgi:type I restriction enzyme, S subunit